MGSYVSVIREYNLKTVQDYMRHIRSNAELSIRNLLRKVVKHLGRDVLEAEDYLDDGTAISVFCLHHIRPVECKVGGHPTGSVSR